MIEMTGDDAKRQRSPHGKVRCQTGRSIAYPSWGGADRTMTKSILFEIDAEIARLRQAKALLSSAGTTAIKRKPGRPSKTAAIVVPVVQKAKKRKKMSAEGRERVRQAQIKRWAAIRLAATPTAKTAAAPLPKPKKKRAAKTAA